MKKKNHADLFREAQFEDDDEQDKCAEQYGQKIKKRENRERVRKPRKEDLEKEE